MSFSASIYAANIHHGGAVSGAASMLEDLAVLHESGDLDWLHTIQISASSLVASNVTNLSHLMGLERIHLTVQDHFPNHLHRRHTWRGPPVDVRFVVRGPDYCPRSGRVEVLGFADRTLFESRGVPTIATEQLKKIVKRRRLTGFDEYVVQTESMAVLLQKRIGGKQITVVPNCVSNVFFSPSAWKPVTLQTFSPGRVRLAYPARAYPHKNHRFIGQVGEALRSRYGIEFEVVTTLRAREIGSIDETSMQFIQNLGEIEIAQCPSLYKSTDGVFFPSLNETFSATPLEGMAMGKPVFAGRLPFVSETCGEFPEYFTPNDADDAARIIANYFSCNEPASTKLLEAEDYVRRLPNALERTRRYMQILRHAARHS